MRPYAYDIMRAIQPFFEIIVFSKLHHEILEKIVDHIEYTLNKPIMEFLRHYKADKKVSPFQRMKKLPNLKIYF